MNKAAFGISSFAVALAAALFANQVVRKSTVPENGLPTMLYVCSPSYPSVVNKGLDFYNEMTKRDSIIEHPQAGRIIESVDSSGMRYRQTNLLDPAEARQNGLTAIVNEEYVGNSPEGSKYRFVNVELHGCGGNSEKLSKLQRDLPWFFEAEKGTGYTLTISTNGEQLAYDLGKKIVLVADSDGDCKADYWEEKRPIPLDSLEFLDKYSR